MTTINGNHAAAGVCIALAVIGAMAAEFHSANRHGIVRNAKDDVRYGGKAAHAETSVDATERRAVAGVAVTGGSSGRRGTDGLAVGTGAAVPVGTGGTALEDDGRHGEAGGVAQESDRPEVTAAPAMSEAEAAPTLCASTPIHEPAPGVCGWYKAQAGDKYHPKHYGPNPYGWGPNYKDVTPNTWHYVYGVTITHVTALPCNDARVTLAVSSGRPNVFCTMTDGGLRQHNADDDALTPLVVFSDGDRLGSAAAAAQPLLGATTEDGR